MDWICDGCGKIESTNELIYIGDMALCNECFENSKCDLCGKPKGIYRYEYDFICEMCKVKVETLDKNQ